MSRPAPAVSQRPALLPCSDNPSTGHPQSRDISQGFSCLHPPGLPLARGSPDGTGALRLSPELRTLPLPATHVGAGTDHLDTDQDLHHRHQPNLQRCNHSQRATSRRTAALRRAGQGVLLITKFGEDSSLQERTSATTRLSLTRARTRSIRAAWEMESNEAAPHYPSRGVAGLGAGDPALPSVGGPRPCCAGWDASTRRAGAAGRAPRWQQGAGAGPVDRHVGDRERDRCGHAGIAGGSAARGDGGRRVAP
jgi:hypothetical protein